MNILLACENLIISLSYFMVVFLIGKDLWKQKNYRSNILATTTGSIFFNCALGHLIHSLSYFLATRYDQITTGYSYLSYVCGTLNIPNPDLVGWIQGSQGVADGSTVIAAIAFLFLRNRYHLLSRTGSIVFDYQQQVAQYQQEDLRLRTHSAELEAQVAKRTVALETALRELEASLLEAESHAIEQTLLLAENEQQRQFIHLLSVPILPVTQDILVIPIVGILDNERLELFQKTALKALERSKIRYLLLDITGVLKIDSYTAQGLIQVVKATKLMGTQTVFIGIRPEVAQSVVELGLELEGIKVYSDLKMALAALVKW